MEIHQDIWENGDEPYISNQAEVYIKLELDAEAVQRVQQEESFYAKIGIQGRPGLPADAGQDQHAEAEEAKGEDDAAATKGSLDGRLLPGESVKPPLEHDNILIACAPYPSNKAQDVLPRYLTRIRQVDCALEGAAAQSQVINQNY